MYCRGCHKIEVGEGGRIDPSLEPLAGRLRPAYLRAMLEEQQHLPPATNMPKPLLPAATLDLVARWLLAGGPPDTRQPADAEDERAGYLSLIDTPLVPTSDASVAGRYARTCAPCHGAGGQGDGYNASFLGTPPARHADAEAMALRPDDSLFDAIAAGGWTMDRSAEMPAFAGSLDPAEMRALVGYIRALCRCAQPAWAESAP
jgi:mono/diheme cytochrome c family protein